MRKRKKEKKRNIVKCNLYFPSTHPHAVNRPVEWRWMRNASVFCFTDNRYSFAWWLIEKNKSKQIVFMSSISLQLTLCDTDRHTKHRETGWPDGSDASHRITVEANGIRVIDRIAILMRRDSLLFQKFFQLIFFSFNFCVFVFATLIFHCWFCAAVVGMAKLSARRLQTRN